MSSKQPSDDRSVISLPVALGATACGIAGIALALTVSVVGGSILIFIAALAFVTIGIMALRRLRGRSA